MRVRVGKLDNILEMLVTLSLIIFFLSHTPTFRPHLPRFCDRLHTYLVHLEYPRDSPEARGSVLA